jgi:outer membrane protein assembly factor BamB
MRLSIAAFLALALAGCGTIEQATSDILPASEAHPPKALKEFAPAARVQVLWQASAGRGSGKDYVRINPYVDDSLIFVAGSNAASAWNKTNGGRVWQTPIDGDITGGVNGGDGNVYLGTGNGNAVALDRQSGQIRWKVPLSSEVLAVSPARNGVVVFRTGDGHLYGLSSQSGERLWQQARQGSTISLRGAGTPIVAGSMVIAGFDSGVVTAFDMQNGNALWEATLSIPQGTNDLTRMTDVDGKLKAQGAALFAASYNGQIVGIDMRNGNIGWSAPYSSYTGVDADPNGLYTTNASGDLWKLNPQSGAPLWKMDDLEYRQPTAPTVAGNYLVAGDAKGYLHWVNASSGQLAARSRGDSAGYIAAPVQDGGVVYALGRGGVLSAFGVQ